MTTWRWSSRISVVPDRKLKIDLQVGLIQVLTFIFGVTKSIVLTKIGIFAQCFLCTGVFGKPPPPLSLPALNKNSGLFGAIFPHLPMLKCQQVFWWLKQSVRAANPQTCSGLGQMAM